MRLTKSLLSVAILAGVGFFATPAAHAESTFNTGVATPLTATARVDFRVTVPRIIFLRVGTGTPLANNPTIDLVDFVVPATNIGTGSAVAATATSGDLGNGVLTARLIANAGDVTLSSTTTGALTNGTGDTISYSQIGVASTVLTSVTPLPSPALVDATTTTVNIPAVGRVVNRDARWTYTYNSTAIAPSGVYGGTAALNGRVTYTASML